MKFNTWIWEADLPNKLIVKAKKLALKNGLENSQIGMEDGSIVQDKNYRISKVCFIKDKDIEEKIWRYILDANAQAFGFDIVKDFAVQFGEYKGKDKGFYDWHIDQSMITDKLLDRKLSIVIQLSDKSEYSGGKLEFEIDGEILTFDSFENKGSVIVFPSFIRHRVTPVTKGVRHSLVSWIKGPNFK